MEEREGENLEREKKINVIKADFVNFFQP